MNYIYTGAVTIILIFVFLILQKKGKSRADYLLIVLNVLMGLFLVSDALVNDELTSERIIFQNLIPFFLFPTFIYYCFEFIYYKSSPSKIWRLLFLPGLAFFCYCLWDHFVFNSYSKDELVAHFNTPSMVYQTFFKGSQLLFIGVLIWVLGKLQKFRGKLKNDFSFIETVSVEWLRNFAIVYLGAISITFLLFLFQNIGLLSLEINEVFGILNGTIVISLFYMDFHGIKHYTVSQVYQSTKTEVEVVTDSKKQVGDLSLNPKANAIHQEMIQLLEDEKIYLEPKLGLKDFAEKLNATPQTISGIINELEKKSFYDLVNGYRVRHLKTMLDDPKNAKLTILALGFDSGFNSKASLNRVFKNTTGITPNEYLKQGLNSSNFE